MSFDNSEVHGVGFEPTRISARVLKTLSLTTRTTMLVYNSYNKASYGN